MASTLDEQFSDNEDDLSETVGVFHPPDDDSEDDAVDGSGWSYLKNISKMQLLAEEDVAEVMFSASFAEFSMDERPVSRLINRIMHPAAASDAGGAAHPFAVAESSPAGLMPPPAAVSRPAAHGANGQAAQKTARTTAATAAAATGTHRDRTARSQNGTSSTSRKFSSGKGKQEAVEKSERRSSASASAASSSPSPAPATAALTQARFENPRLPAGYKQAAAAATMADDRPDSAASRSPHLEPLESAAVLLPPMATPLPPWAAAGPSPPASAPASTLPSPTGRAKTLAPLKSSSSSAGS